MPPTERKVAARAARITWVIEVLRYLRVRTILISTDACPTRFGAKKSLQRARRSRATGNYLSYFTLKNILN
jgi:hypothetical protein